MRSLDKDKAIDCLAEWVVDVAGDAPGLVLGLSGTDSTLTYLVCSKALKLIGEDPNHLVGIHYGESWKHKDWFAQFGAVEIVSLPESEFLETDVHRWAALQTYALKHRFWIVGTRNRTEQTLGDYSNASSVAVLQPLVQFWKSEVLSLCAHLGVPEQIIAASLEGDPKCYCHRPALNSRLGECETVLSAREGDIDQKVVEQEPFYKDTSLFLDIFRKGKTYKNKIPYCPSTDVLAGAILKEEDRQ